MKKIRTKKRLIGNKEYLASPMTRGLYNSYRGWQSPKDEDPESEGYSVEELDGGKPNDERHQGYISWSPKDVFEKAYQLAETPLDRMRIEGTELCKKFSGLSSFIASDKFKELDTVMQAMLRVQYQTMCDYWQILNQRTTRMEANNGGSCSLSFGQAIEYLKAGLAIRRTGWNGKDLFVVKQIPAHITEEIIPKMQSLPQYAKDIIMSRENKAIYYTNQMLIVNAEGRADSWVPSSSDVFAEDWEIVI